MNRLAVMLIATSCCFAEYEIPSTRTNNWRVNTIAPANLPDLSGWTNYTNISPGTVLSTIQSRIITAPVSNYITFLDGEHDLGSTGLDIDKNHFAIKGQSLGGTILKGNAASAGNTIIRFSGGFNGTYQTAVGINSGYTQGSSNLVLASSPGWSVGDVIVIDEQPKNTQYKVYDNGSDSTCSWCGRQDGAQYRVRGQVCKVYAISGANLTIDPPLAYAGYTDEVPQAARMNPSEVESVVGIQDLTITNISTTASGNALVSFTGVDSGWVKNVTLLKHQKRGILVQDSVRVNIFQTALINGAPSALTSAASWGNDDHYVIMLERSSFCRIENVYMNYAFFALAMEGLNTGHVVAFVYAHNGVKNPVYAASTMMGTHAPHPTHILWEHNAIEEQFFFDNIFGTTSDHTIFRSRVWHVHNKFYGSGQLIDQSARNISMWGKNWNLTVINSDLGHDTETTSFEYANNADPWEGGGNLVIRHIGNPDQGDTTISTYDTNTVQTLIWDGVYDTIGDTWRWDDSATNTFPKSLLYPDGPPSYWPSVSLMPFPAIGMEVGHLSSANAPTKIPAGYFAANGAWPTPGVGPSGGGGTARGQTAKVGTLRSP